MPSAQIRSLDFLTREASSATLRASLEDGKESTFPVAAPDRPAAWIAEKGFFFGPPALFVARVDEETVAEAAQAMAAEMGGYWLRYYRSKEDPAAPKKAKVVTSAVTEIYPPRSADHGCAVVQVSIGDGREFSLLSATPSWFEKAFAELKLSYYYGPSVLFLKKLDPKLARKAVTAMAADGDRWLTRYDTPRRTLPEVLADFKAKHP